MRPGALRAAALVAAWLPIALFWTLVLVVYGRVPVGESLLRSVLTIGAAALLGVAVWRHCARTPWPHELRVRFYARHFGAAAAYAALWVLALYAIEPLLSGMPLWRSLFESRVVGWQLIMGVWLYGVIAGVSYAIQSQRRARENERRALLAEAGLAAAKLDALRSRLQPHFLFNALHTVAALVRHDPAQAESALEKLGDILRYTLETTDVDRVPFAEEWELTRRYLEFEQLRFGERLRVEAEIDPAGIATAVPLFALQTLVENAVRHAIATRPEGGTVAITARAGHAELLVSVRDDGASESAAPENGSRFGLQALRERLGALYGDAARLTVDSGPVGFEVSFTVPRLRDQDADEE
jgi:LytS/YehU family sensor histidine kinase